MKLCFQLDSISQNDNRVRQKPGALVSCDCHGRVWVIELNNELSRQLSRYDWLNKVELTFQLDSMHQNDNRIYKWTSVRRVLGDLYSYASEDDCVINVIRISTSHFRCLSTIFPVVMPSTELLSGSCKVIDN